MNINLHVTTVIKMHSHKKDECNEMTHECKTPHLINDKSTMFQPKLIINHKSPKKYGFMYTNALREALFTHFAKPYQAPGIPSSLSEESDNVHQFTCRQCKDRFHHSSSLEEHTYRGSWILGYWCKNCFQECEHLHGKKLYCSKCIKLQVHKFRALQSRGLKKNDDPGIVKIFFNPCQLLEHMQMHNVEEICVHQLMLLPFPSGIGKEYFPHLKMISEALMDSMFLKNIHIVDWLTQHKINKWWRMAKGDNPVANIIKKYPFEVQQIKQLLNCNKICKINKINNDSNRIITSENKNQDTENVNKVISKSDSNLYQSDTNLNVLDSEKGLEMASDITFVDCGRYNSESSINIDKGITDSPINEVTFSDDNISILQNSEKVYSAATTSSTKISVKKFAKTSVSSLTDISSTKPKAALNSDNKTIKPVSDSSVVTIRSAKPVNLSSLIKNFPQIAQKVANKKIVFIHKNISKNMEMKSVKDSHNNTHIKCIPSNKIIRIRKMQQRSSLSSDKGNTLKNDPKLNQTKSTKQRIIIDTTKFKTKIIKKPNYKINSIKVSPSRKTKIIKKVNGLTDLISNVEIVPSVSQLKTVADLNNTNNKKVIFEKKQLVEFLSSLKETTKQVLLQFFQEDELMFLTVTKHEKSGKNFLTVLSDKSNNILNDDSTYRSKMFSYLSKMNKAKILQRVNYIKASCRKYSEKVGVYNDSITEGYCKLICTLQDVANYVDGSNQPVGDDYFGPLLDPVGGAICTNCSKITKPTDYLIGFSTVTTDLDYCVCYDFICYKCNNFQGSKERFHIHLKYHEYESPFICPECNGTFLSLQSLTVHTWTKCFHPFVRRFLECSICQINGFCSMESIVHHFVIMHSFKMSACSLCCMVFDYKRFCLSHMKKGHQESVNCSGPLELTICQLDDKIIPIESYNYHMNNHKCIKESIFYKCILCPSNVPLFESSELIKVHVYKHHYLELSTVIDRESLNEIMSLEEIKNIIGEKLILTKPKEIHENKKVAEQFQNEKVLRNMNLDVQDPSQQNKLYKHCNNNEHNYVKEIPPLNTGHDSNNLTDSLELEDNSKQLLNGNSSVSRITSESSERLPIIKETSSSILDLNKKSLIFNKETSNNATIEVECNSPISKDAVNNITLNIPVIEKIIEDNYSVTTITSQNNNLISKSKQLVNESPNNSQSNYLSAKSEENTNLIQSIDNKSKNLEHDVIQKSTIKSIPCQEMLDTCVQNNNYSINMVENSVQHLNSKHSLQSNESMKENLNESNENKSLINDCLIEIQDDVTIHKISCDQNIEKKDSNIERNTNLKNIPCVENAGDFPAEKINDSIESTICINEINKNIAQVEDSESEEFTLEIDEDMFEQSDVINVPVSTNSELNESTNNKKIVQLVCQTNVRSQTKSDHTKDTMITVSSTNPLNCSLIDVLDNHPDVQCKTVDSSCTQNKIEVIKNADQNNLTYTNKQQFTNDNCKEITVCTQSVTTVSENTINNKESTIVDSNCTLNNLQRRMNNRSALLDLNESHKHIVMDIFKKSNFEGLQESAITDNQYIDSNAIKIIHKSNDENNIEQINLRLDHKTNTNECVNRDTTEKLDENDKIQPIIKLKTSSISDKNIVLESVKEDSVKLDNQISEQSIINKITATNISMTLKVTDKNNVSDFKESEEKIVVKSTDESNQKINMTERDNQNQPLNNDNDCENLFFISTTTTDLECPVMQIDTSDANYVHGNKKCIEQLEVNVPVNNERNRVTSDQVTTITEDAVEKNPAHKNENFEKETITKSVEVTNNDESFENLQVEINVVVDGNDGLIQRTDTDNDQSVNKIHNEQSRMLSDTDSFYEKDVSSDSERNIEELITNDCIVNHIINDNIDSNVLLENIQVEESQMTEMNSNLDDDTKNLAYDENNDLSNSADFDYLLCEKISHSNNTLINKMSIDTHVNITALHTKSIDIDILGNYNQTEKKEPEIIDKLSDENDSDKNHNETISKIEKGVTTLLEKENTNEYKLLHESKTNEESVFSNLSPIEQTNFIEKINETNKKKFDDNKEEACFKLKQKITETLKLSSATGDSTLIVLCEDNGNITLQSSRIVSNKSNNIELNDSIYSEEDSVTSKSDIKACDDYQDYLSMNKNENSSNASVTIETSTEQPANEFKNKSENNLISNSNDLLKSEKEIDSFSVIKTSINCNNYELKNLPLTDDEKITLSKSSETSSTKSRTLKTVNLPKNTEFEHEKRLRTRVINKFNISSPQDIKSKRKYNSKSKIEDCETQELSGTVIKKSKVTIDETNNDGIKEKLQRKLKANTLKCDCTSDIKIKRLRNLGTKYNKSKEENIQCLENNVHNESYDFQGRETMLVKRNLKRNRAVASNDDLQINNEQIRIKDFCSREMPNLRLIKTSTQSISVSFSQQSQEKFKIGFYNGIDFPTKISKFKCHLCGDTINTSWQVLKDHYSRKHMHNFEVCFISPKLSRLCNDDFCRFSEKKLNKKRKSSEIPFVTIKKRKRWSPKRANEKSVPTAERTSGLFVQLESVIDGEGHFKCKKCDERCIDMIELRQHIADNHRIAKKNLICLECGENFVVSPSLEMHLKAFHGIDDPIAYMHQYPAYAPDIVDLEAEAKTTTANQCHVCMAVFKDKAAVDKHLRVHGMAFLNKKRIEARNAQMTTSKKHEKGSSVATRESRKISEHYKNKNVSNWRSDKIHEEISLR